LLRQVTNPLYWLPVRSKVVSISSMS
jgi:hypothetical protein